MSSDFRKEHENDKSQWHFLNKKGRTAYDNGDDIPSDVLGSYTGTAFDDSEPVQDADDL